MTTRSGTKQQSEWSDHPAKTLISTAAFNTEFYSYSTSYDSNQRPRGYLTVNPAATANKCPVDRVLNLNGKRLVPGVNPMTDFGTTGLGPSPGTFLLGVFDSYSGLSGYINPSSATFILKDTNRPPADFLVDMSVGQTPAKSTSLGGDAAPLITSGTVELVGFSGIGTIVYPYPLNLANYSILLWPRVDSGDYTAVIPSITNITTGISSTNIDIQAYGLFFVRYAILNGP
jgi:hypothetical protein